MGEWEGAPVAHGEDWHYAKVKVLHGLRRVVLKAGSCAPASDVAATHLHCWQDRADELTKATDNAEVDQRKKVTKRLMNHSPIVRMPHCRVMTDPNILG